MKIIQTSQFLSAKRPAVDALRVYAEEFVSTSSFWQWLERNNKILRLFPRNLIGKEEEDPQLPKYQIGRILLNAYINYDLEINFRCTIKYNSPKVTLSQDLRTWICEEYGDPEEAVTGRKLLTELRDHSVERTMKYMELYVALLKVPHNEDIPRYNQGACLILAVDDDEIRA